MILRVISAQSTIFEGEVKSVTLPGEKGSFMVLQNHASIVSTLVKGKLSYQPVSGEEVEQVNRAWHMPGNYATINITVSERLERLNMQQIPELLESLLQHRCCARITTEAAIPGSCFVIWK